MSSSVYGDFSRERAARARRLLKETEEHSGSSDLQKFVESIEFSDQLHELFQDGERPREGLSARQKQQGLVTFCRFLLASTAMPACTLRVKPPTRNAMVEVAAELLIEHVHIGQPFTPLGLLALLSDAALFCLEGHRLQLSTCVEQALKLIDRWDGLHAVAVQLEALQRSSGFEPQLSAAQMRSLVYGLVLISSRLLSQMEEQAGREQQAQQHLESAVKTCRQLIVLQPSDAAYKAMLGSMAMRVPHSTQAAVPALRAAFAATDNSTDHWTAAVASLTLAQSLAAGMAGPSWSVAEVQHLLQRAQHHARLCKAWLPAPMGNTVQISNFKAFVARAVSAHPGASTIPVIKVKLDTSHTDNLRSQKCSHCKQHAYQLKRCSACKKVAYCSVECQRLAWKSGHKRECAELAAQRG